MATVAKFAIVQHEDGGYTTATIYNRFMMIDYTDVYHIGTSLKDLGKNMYAFSKLDIPSKAITDLL